MMAADMSELPNPTETVASASKSDACLEAQLLVPNARCLLLPHQPVSFRETETATWPL